MRKVFIMQHAGGIWNALPADVVKTGFVIVFKMKLDKYTEEQNCKAMKEGPEGWN